MTNIETFDHTSLCYVHHVRFDKYYTTMANSTFADPNLSWEAKGLLGYILSRDPGWRIHVWQLSSIYCGGKKRGQKRDAIREILKELRAAGYVIYRKTRNSEGKWEHHYHTFPIPYEKFKIMFPEAELPATELPALVKPAVIPKNELPKNELLNKEKQQQHAPAREPVEEKKIAAAAFSKELKELGISDEDAVAIGKDFTEKEIMAAVSFVKKKISSGKCSNPGGMLITFLRKKWQSPCSEAPPPLVQTEDIQAKRQEQAAMTTKANKQFHEELAKTHKLKDGHTIQTMLGDLVISKPNGLSETLNYEFEWFQQSIKKYYELK